MTLVGLLWMLLPWWWLTIVPSLAFQAPHHSSASSSWLIHPAITNKKKKKNLLYHKGRLGGRVVLQDASFPPSSSLDQQDIVEWSKDASTEQPQPQAALEYSSLSSQEDGLFLPEQDVMGLQATWQFLEQQPEDAATPSAQQVQEFWTQSSLEEEEDSSVSQLSQEPLEEAQQQEDDPVLAATEDTVQAILAASQEAVVEAEASFVSQQVADQLETFPESSTTTTRSAMEQDDPPPPIVTAASVVLEGHPEDKDSVPTLDPEQEPQEQLEPLSSTAAAISSSVMEAPTLWQMIRFAIPATGVWLCSPLLSLIDTSTVGLLAGTTHQAALNPAVAVTEYSALCIAFLYTGTTNLMARARVAAAQSTNNDPNNHNNSVQSTLLGSLQLSTYVGLALGLVLFVGAPHGVRLLLGSSSALQNPAVVEAAATYVRIRALGMPAAAWIGTAQAACLGLQDATSPLAVLVAAAVVNLLGDLILVRQSHISWLGGAAGAAWATTLSQYAAVALFVQWLGRKAAARSDTTLKEPPRSSSSSTITKTARTVNISRSILELMRSGGKSTRTTTTTSVHAQTPRASPETNTLPQPPRRRNWYRRQRSPVATTTTTTATTTDATTTNSAAATRGLLEGRLHELTQIPSAAVRRAFGPYLLPVTSTQIGRVSCYVAMSHVVSSTMGTLAMAAQQVILSFFYSITPLADSLGLTAQSFVPPLLMEHDDDTNEPPWHRQHRARALRQTMTNLAKVGVVLGGFLVAAMSSIPFLAQWSTSDPAVLAVVAETIPYLAAASLVHPTVTAFEGLLLGRKDLAFVGKLYTAWFVLVPTAMLRLKQQSTAVKLASVWQVFFVYQLVRCTTWVGRSLLLQGRTEREAARVSSSHP